MFKIEIVVWVKIRFFKWIFEICTHFCLWVHIYVCICIFVYTHILGCYPSQDASVKWRFRLGSPNRNDIILVVAATGRQSLPIYAYIYKLYVHINLYTYVDICHIIYIYICILIVLFFFLGGCWKRHQLYPFCRSWYEKDIHGALFGWTSFMAIFGGIDMCANPSKFAMKQQHKSGDCSSNPKQT